MRGAHLMMIRYVAYRNPPPYPAPLTTQGRTRQRRDVHRLREPAQAVQSALAIERIHARDQITRPATLSH